MSRNTCWSCSIKNPVLKNFAIFIGKYLCWCIFLIKLFQQRYIPVNIAKFFGTLILNNICKRLLLNVIFNSNGEQHFLDKLDEMG